MDVADLRPDELGPDEPAGLAAGPRRQRSRTLLRLLPLVVLAGLLAWLALLLLDRQDRAARDDARQAALAAARQEAVDLTTLSYETARRDVDRILAGSTGPLHEKFAAQRDRLPSVLAQDRSSSTGTVLSAALVRLSDDGGRARVLVAADAAVTTNPPDGERQSTVKHYRMVMRLVLVDGHWLARAVAFAGVPR